jgi:hypothetical protein
MPDTSPNLVLPYLMPSQAQKHVTHNEALQLLDAVVQLTVEAFGATTPPARPAAGQVWALGPSPGGAWAGQGRRLAARIGGDWVFIDPLEGWRAWGRAEAELRVWRGTLWDRLPLQNLDGLGIASVYDTTNRLSVASPATLLTHAGGGHQLKINKAGPGQTASLLYQTDWSGRAEMGLAGGDNFSVKVSADGATWAEALVADRTTGRLRLPDGDAETPALAFDNGSGVGLFRPDSGQMGFATGGVQRALLSGTALQLDVPLIGAAVTASAADTTAGRVLRVGAGWSQLDATLYRQGNLLGTVSQSAGAPTGAVIERGSNGGGDYVRFADGTKICTATLTRSTSAAVGWTYPMAFAAAPCVTGTAQAAVLACVMLDSAPAASVASLSVRDKLDARRADPMRLMAVGRWF